MQAVECNMVLARMENQASQRVDGLLRSRAEHEHAERSTGLEGARRHRTLGRLIVSLLRRVLQKAIPFP